jgi:hypothetical protein
MSSAIIVQDWDADGFHRQVSEMEAQGYMPRQETYRITPIVNPETGRITHLYRIEMYLPGNVEEREDERP